MSWLFLLNFCILQWFGIRLARVIDTETNAQIGWRWWRVRPLKEWTFK